jgi:hypothetical protein
VRLRLDTFDDRRIVARMKNAGRILVGVCFFACSPAVPIGVGGSGAAGGATGVAGSAGSTSGSGGGTSFAACRFQKAAQPLRPAFCDAFDAPDPNSASRSGDLDAELWGVSRIGSTVNITQGEYNWFYSAELEGCGAPQKVLPPHDVRICNGRLVEALRDTGGLPTIALYPKQPFDIAGRTGTVVFDLSADSDGPHAAWPEFWWTDQPVPAPHAELATAFPYARNAFGFMITLQCPNNQIGIEKMWAIRNYVLSEIPFSITGCVNKGSLTGALNHFEVLINQNRVEVWGTDPGSTAIKQLAVANDANLSMTRGLIWLEHLHYNACKFDDQCDHTFAWDNVGFDGPSTYRDLSFDAQDALVPIDADTVELGYRVGAAGRTIPVPGVFRRQAPTGAIVTFNWYAVTTTVPQISLNGGPVHSTSWPFDGATYGWRTIAVPVPLGEVVDGTNAVRFISGSDTVVSNVNLILIAGAPVP